MPELPDVQVFREYLDATSLHRKIGRIHVSSDEVLDGVTPQSLGRALHGRELAATRRHGKVLLVQLSGDDDPPWLALHFGMTGELRAFDDLADEPEYDRLRMDFEDGRHLAYVCPRKLGSVGLTESLAALAEAKDLGPDALDIDRDTFVDALTGKRGTLKGALMNQSVIAGIGNEYSDEILFQLGLHPETELSELDEDDLGEAWDTMREVLEEAIADRVDVERMPDSWMLPHRHGDGLCPRCGEEMEKIGVVGRHAVFCPRDQSRP